MSVHTSKSARQYSLSRQLLLHGLLTTVAIVICALSAIIGLSGLNNDFSVADDTHLELRHIFETGYQLSEIRDLNLTSTSHFRVQAAFQKTLAAAAPLKQRQEYLKEEEVQALLRAIESLRTNWQQGQDEAITKSQVNQVLGQIAQLSQTIGKRLENTRKNARERYLETTWIVLSTAVFTILLSIILNLRHRQSVRIPLAYLTDAAQRYQTAPTGSEIFIDLATWRRHRYLEFDQLAQQLNQMATELTQLYDTLENKVQIQSRQLITQEKLASVGQLAAGVAHEINNPLAIIANYAQSLERDLRNTPQCESLHIIVEEAFRCKSLTDKLLSLARRQDAGEGKCDLSIALIHIEQLSKGLPEATERNIQFQKDIPSQMIQVHEADFTQILLNLISNAIQSTETKDTINIIVTPPERDQVSILVKDTGCGITEENLDHIFDPFYSKRKETQSAGIGLGLAITHALVEKNQGKITVHSQLEQGTEFILEFPTISEQAT